MDSSACIANSYNTPEYELVMDAGFFDNLDNLENAFSDNNFKDYNLSNNASEGNAVDDSKFSNSAFNEMFKDEQFMPTAQEAPMSFSAFRSSIEPTCGSRNVGPHPRWDDSSYNARAGHHEIRELLCTMTARLERIEGAAARDSETLRQLCFSVDRSLPRLLDMSQSLRDAMGELKRSLKVFTQGILDHLLGWHVEGDLEAGESA
ncbi:hypothetical protein B0T10DRAFT_459681 [Thelonectria olida]|uniref:Uncharacterized protein n=1 Tax=Thelonectria olida TaxID=1576542 RepID=A0A9P9AQQ4_9HYPO|nr:hypothetical protein B0T10DRAFT_459681 [Thelonectria olida]